MPSVASKQDPVKLCPAEAAETGYRSLQVYVEKKIRNLDKKKKRLDEYQKTKQKGEKLEQQQEEALASMGIVIGNLEFARDILIQINNTANEQEKAAKKAEKKQRIERERREVDTLKSLLLAQSLLDEMGNDLTKQLFAGESPAGGLALTETEIQSLDELYQAITPRRESEGEPAAAAAADGTAFQSRLQVSAENCVNLLEGKEKPLAGGVTFRQAKELLDRLTALPYFTANAVPRVGRQQPDEPEPDEAPAAEAADDEDVAVDAAPVAVAADVDSTPPASIESHQFPSEPLAVAVAAVDGNHVDHQRHHPPQLPHQQQPQHHQLQPQNYQPQPQHHQPQPQHHQQSQPQHHQQPQSQQLQPQQLQQPQPLQSAAGSLNEIRQIVKGQFDFIQESEIAAEETVGSGVSNDVAAAPADWGEELGDDQQPGQCWADSWDPSMQPQQLLQPASTVASATAAVTAATGSAAPGSEDVFASATQSAFLKTTTAADHPQHHQPQQYYHHHQQQQQQLYQQQQPLPAAENGPSGYGGRGGGRGGYRGGGSGGGANDFRGGRGSGGGGGNFRGGNRGGGGGNRGYRGGDFRGGPEYRGGSGGPEYRGGGAGGADFHGAGGGGGGRAYGQSRGGGGGYGRGGGGQPGYTRGGAGPQ